MGFHPWVGKIPWRRRWQPAPVFLTRESHGQRTLASYSPEGHKESDMTEHACAYAQGLRWHKWFPFDFSQDHPSICVKKSSL